jgi:hypothetical protein
MPVAWAECTKRVTLPNEGMLSVLSPSMLLQHVGSLIRLCISEPKCLLLKTGLAREEIRTPAPLLASGIR